MSGKWGETPVKLANIMRRSTEDSPQMLLLKQAVQGIADVSAKLASIAPNTSYSFGSAGGLIYQLGSNPIMLSELMNADRGYAPPPGYRPISSGADASTTGNETPLVPPDADEKVQDNHPINHLHRRKEPDR
jgi:hypothetical protein